MPVKEGGIEEELPPPELPKDVQAKLQRLLKLEEKYGQLLRAYKIAHARVQTIAPFESSLRENTPLTTIAEPVPFVEYLSQLNLKGDMVMQELKRVTADNDATKKKLEGSEKEKAVLQTEVKELKEKLETLPAVNAEAAAPAPINTLASESPTAADLDKTSVLVKSPTDSITSRVPSFSLFSPKAKAAKSPPPNESEEFFSYDTEVPRLESELQEKDTEIENLKKEATSLKGDLAVARESTEGMVQSLEGATRELHALRDSADKSEVSKKELESKIDRLRKEVSEGQSRVLELEKQIESARTEKEQVARDRDEKVAQFEESLNKSTENVSHMEQVISRLREQVGQNDTINKDLEDSLAMKLSAERQETKKHEDLLSDKKIATMQGIMNSLRTQLDTAQKAVADMKVELQDKQNEFAARPSTKAFSFLDDSSGSEVMALDSKDSVLEYVAKHYNLSKVADAPPTISDAPASNLTAPPDPATVNAGKKKSKNKKKKSKGGQERSLETPDPDLPQKVSEDLASVEDDPPLAATKGSAEDGELRSQIEQLKGEIETKEAAIQRLSSQIKDQEALREEIETLRDDLLHQGEEHVEARDLLKTSHAEKATLQETVSELEKELEEVQTKVSADADSERTHEDLAAQLDNLKTQSTTLQTDLAAAEQLAASRFKDVTDLRELLSRAQTELRSLRTEVAELRSTRDALKNKTGDLSRLEARHEDIKAEMKGLSKRLGDKDSELKEIQQKIELETSARRRLEDDLDSTKTELRYAEARKKEVDEQASQTSKYLSAAKEESLRLKAKFTDLDDQLSSHNKLVAELREELSLKAALHTTSQSMVNSLREQTHELSIQAREASTRAESLEEELAEAQRMLLERTREGQTMRMLLNQAETGAESKIRDMKDRMEAAIEERDRAEEDASLQSRRVMREVEDVRAKARAAAAELKQAQDERDELQDKQKDWKRKREDLEAAAEKMTAEVTETKSAMDRLRQALDESERQIEDLEKQRNDVRKREDEARNRVEKLASANKSLSEELKTAQSAARKSSVRPGLASPLQSSRTSFDSPSVRSATPTERSEAPTGPNAAKVDYVYLKNVLLQFLEQKDKGHQKQLIPVLGMLLHFDKKDEQKWMTAISAR